MQFPSLLAVAALGDEITTTEAMTEATMTVTITAGHTGEHIWNI